MISLVTTLILAQASSAWDKPIQSPDIRPRLYRSEGPFRLSRLGGSDDTGLFEFAPASGLGMTAACACTNPTGSRGETMTLTRSSAAICTKGNTTSSIADGDLVSCGNNLARVMPGGDGTGTLGLLLEITRTNAALRSQEIDNAAWTKDQSASAIPTIRADLGVAPDGTQTADAVHFFPTTTTGQSIVYQNGIGNGVNSFSIYVKGAPPADGGVAGSGTIDFLTIVASAGSCMSCAYNPNTWTRCTLENQNSNLGGYIWFGNDGFQCGSGTRAEQDVYVWGAQAEAGVFVSSYIPTTSAAVARSADSTATFTMSQAVGPNFSLAASAIWPSVNATIATAAQLGTAAPDMARVGRNGNTSARFTINSTVVTPAVSAMGVTEHRASLADTGGVREAYWDLGLSTAPAASMTGSTTAAVIGVSNGVVKKVCIDSNPTRCR